MNRIIKFIHSVLRKIFYKTLIADILGRTPRFKQSIISLKYFLKIIFSKEIKLSFSKRFEILERFKQIRLNVPCAHSFNEILIPFFYILSNLYNKVGCIVEAGAYKGGGTAKLSIIAKYSDKKLFVFDSFEGLPKNNEQIVHTSMGYSHTFNQGEYLGSLDEVKNNVKRYGEINMCHFVQGWFENTMIDFNEKISLVFCDVDLVSSNKTCLKYLWNKIEKGGMFFSQDMHIPEVNKLFFDENYWISELGVNQMPKYYKITNRFGYFLKN